MVLNSDGVYISLFYVLDVVDIVDSSNLVWIWVLGVKEKVLDIVIVCGYVVFGGYFLEFVKIVNGEGYYNFYVINN